MAEKVVLAEFEFDTTQIEKATEENVKLKQSMIELKKETSEINKQIKKNGEVSEENSKILQNNDETLKSMNATYRDNSKVIQANANSVKNINNLLSETVKTETQALNSNRKLLQARKGINITTKEGAKQVQLINEKINKNNQLINKNADNYSKQKRNIGNYKSALKGLGAQFLTLFGAMAVIRGIGRAFSDAFNRIQEFDKAIKSLSAITGATGKDLEFLKNQAIKLGSVTTLSAIQVADGFKLIGSQKPELLGNAKALAEVTRQTIILAEASGNTMVDSARAVTGALNLFGKGAESAAEFVDVLAAGSKFGAGDVNFLNEALLKSGAVADKANLSFTDTAAALETLAPVMESGAVAGTKFRNILINLQKAGIGFASGQFDINDALAEAKKKFEDIENPVKKTTAMVNLFGKQNLVAGIQLLSNIDTLEGFQKSLSTTGIALEQQAINTSALTADKVKLTSAWEGLILSIDSGEGAVGRATHAILGLGVSILNTLTPAQSLSAEFFEFETQVNDLEASMIPLLDRYDELNTKSELSVDEQTELNEIIKEIARNIPSAIIEFDDYGRAIDVSTEASREFIKQQKNLLLVKNRVAIQDTTEEIEKQENALANLNTEYTKAADGTLLISKTLAAMEATSTTVTKATDEEVIAYQDRLNIIQTNIDGGKALVAQLRGEKTEVQKKSESDQAAIKATAKVKADADADESKNKEKTEAELKKIAAERKKRERVAAAEKRKLDKEELATQKEILDNALLSAEIELTIFKDNHQRKLDSNQFFTDELLLQEQTRLDEVLKKETEHLDKKLELGLIKTQAHEEAVRQLKEGHRVENEAIELERDVAKKEQEFIDLENQIAIDEESYQNDFVLQSERLEQKRLQEIEDAEKTGADTKIINEKYATLQKTLDQQVTDFKADQRAQILSGLTSLFGESSGLGKAFAAADIANTTITNASKAFQQASVFASNPLTAGLAVNANIQGGIIIASGAAQVAKLIKPPKAEEGMLVGPAHSQGGVHIEAEGGEGIINKKSMSDPILRNIASAINVAGGGIDFSVPNHTGIFADGGITAQNLDTAIPETQNIKVINVVEDTMNTFNEEVVQVQNVANL